MTFGLVGHPTDEASEAGWESGGVLHTDSPSLHQLREAKSARPSLVPFMMPRVLLLDRRLVGYLATILASPSLFFGDWVLDLKQVWSLTHFYLIQQVVIGHQ